MDQQIPEEFIENYIPIKNRLNWDEYFMLQAMIAAFKSKDPVTKVGCVFVDENKHQITMGYNGFVAGIDEGMLPWGKNKELPLEHQKYGYVVHAEANAILHSPGSLAGSTLYVTHFPCHECAKLIASSKVSRIVYLYDKHLGCSSNVISKKIFQLSGIKHEMLTLKMDILNDLHQHLVEMIEGPAQSNPNA
jgi:dCMP deaminase